MKTLSEPHPVLLLVSAPSGAGKTTLCHRLLAKHPEIVYSVSSTTRHPREGETHGQDYDFLDVDAFQVLIQKHAFLEYAEVHGNFYGTRLDAVMEPFRSGRSVLLDVDVDGAAQIRERLSSDENLFGLRAAFVDVFIAPPTLGALRERLEGRGKDAADVIETRLQNAADEVAQASRYQYHLLNDDLNESVACLEAIYRANRMRNCLPTF